MYLIPWVMQHPINEWEVTPVLLSMSEQSGYFVLEAQEEGLLAGLYRVDLFMGEEASTIDTSG